MCLEFSERKGINAINKMNYTTQNSTAHFLNASPTKKNLPVNGKLASVLVNFMQGILTLYPPYAIKGPILSKFL